MDFLDHRDVGARFCEHLDHNLRHCRLPHGLGDRQMMLRHRLPWSQSQDFFPVGTTGLRSDHFSEPLEALGATCERHLGLVGVPQEHWIAGFPQERIVATEEAPAALREHVEVVLVLASQAAPARFVGAALAVLRHEHAATKGDPCTSRAVSRTRLLHEVHHRIATTRRSRAAARASLLGQILAAQAAAASTESADRSPQLRSSSALARLVRRAELRRVAAGSRATVVLVGVAGVAPDQGPVNLQARLCVASGVGRSNRNRLRCSLNFGDIPAGVATPHGAPQGMPSFRSSIALRRGGEPVAPVRAPLRAALRGLEMRRAHCVEGPPVHESPTPTRGLVAPQPAAHLLPRSGHAQANLLGSHWLGLVVGLVPLLVSELRVALRPRVLVHRRVHRRVRLQVVRRQPQRAHAHVLRHGLVHLRAFLAANLCPAKLPEAVLEQRLPVPFEDAPALLVRAVVRKARIARVGVQTRALSKLHEARAAPTELQNLLLPKVRVRPFQALLPLLVRQLADTSKLLLVPLPNQLLGFLPETVPSVPQLLRLWLSRLAALLHALHVSGSHGFFFLTAARTVQEL